MINVVNIFGGQCWTHYPRCPTVTKARYCCSTAALQHCRRRGAQIIPVEELCTAEYL